MRRAAALALLLLTTAPEPTIAGGINLAWNTCLPDGGAINRSSTCSGETAYELVGSYQLDQPQPNFVGLEIDIGVLRLPLGPSDVWSRLRLPHRVYRSSGCWRQS